MQALFGPAGNSLSFYAQGNKSTHQAPAWLSQMGLGAYEYQAGNGVRGSDEAFAKIAQEARTHKIKLSLHAPYFISLSGVEQEKRLKSIDYIGQSLHAAEMLGADTIVIHTGSAAKISRAEAMNLARDTLYKTLETFPNNQIHLGLETMGKLNQLGTLEEVIDLCRMDSALYPVVDFGHLNARENGRFFSCDDYRRVFDAIGSALTDEKARYLHCHFSMIEYTQAGEKKHLTFADKIYGPRFEPLMEALVKDDLAPRIICESDGTMAEDALAMQNCYRAYFL
jgi:deoxyribonuclease-4